MKKLAAILMTLVLLTSCSGQAVELMDFIGENEGEFLGYGGVTIVIAQPDDSETSIFSYAINDTIQSDALIKRIKTVESDLDLKLELTNKGMSTYPDYYINAALSDNMSIDMVFRDGGASAWPLAEVGVLYPINEFPEYIDLSDTDKYGTPGVLESVMFDGVPYAVQPTYWPGFQGTESFLVCYNIDMVKSLGLTDLHEYYENETWTWDTFTNVMNSAQNIIRDDELLFTGHSGRLLNTVLFANGHNFVDVVNGELEFNIQKDDAVTALEFYQSLVTGYEEKVRISNDRWLITEFISGKALMALSTARDVTTGDIAYQADFEYGLMPFPSGPDATYGEWAQTVTRTRGFSIFKSSSEPEICAHVISEMFEPFEEFGGSRESLIEYYAESVFINPIDAEIYFAVDKNVRFDYDDFGIISLFEGMSSELKSKSVAETLQKYEPRILDIYEKYMKPNLEGYMLENMDIE